MNIERAAEVMRQPASWITHEYVDSFDFQARRLAAEGLLRTDRDQQLINLGQAVENLQAVEQPWQWYECMTAIHDEAARLR